MKDFEELLFGLFFNHPKFKEFLKMLCCCDHTFRYGWDKEIDSWVSENFEELKQIFSTIKFGNTKFEFNDILFYPVINYNRYIEVVFLFIFSEKDYYHNEFAIEFPLSMLEYGKLPKSYDEYKTIFALLEL